MPLLSLPGDVLGRVGTLLLRLEYVDEGPYGEDYRDRDVMLASGRAVLRLAATCREYKKILLHLGMLKEARARCETFVWPVHLSYETQAVPGLPSHVYVAQRDEEKHSKAQLRTLREAIEAFVCGKPRRHHQRAFLENAGAKRKCQVRVIIGQRGKLDEDDRENDVIGVMGGFLFQVDPDTSPSFDELRIWWYDGPTVQDNPFGERVGTISSPDACPTFLDLAGTMEAQLFEAPSGVDVLFSAHKSDDTGRVQIFYEHYWLDRSKGTMNLLFSKPMMSYAADNDVFEQMPIRLLLDEYGGHHALLHKYDIDSEGDSNHDASLRRPPAYQIQFLDAACPIWSVEYPIWTADAAAATTQVERADYLNGWIHQSSAEIRGYVAVSTGTGMRIHSGECFETIEDVTCPFGLGSWGPLLPSTFSPNGQFLIAKSPVNWTDRMADAVLIFAQNPATGRFNDYPYVRLTAENRRRTIQSQPVFTECSRYCVFQTREEWHYIDLVSVFGRLRPYAGVVSHDELVPQVERAVGRPLAPGLREAFPNKQPRGVVFESGGVTVLCNDHSLLRLTTARRPSNLGPPRPAAAAAKP